MTPVRYWCMLIFTDISVKFHMAYRYAGWKLSRPHTRVIRTQEVFHSGSTGTDQSWNGSVRVLCNGRHGRLPLAACWLGEVKGRNRDCGVVEDRARRAPPGGEARRGTLTYLPVQARQCWWWEQQGWYAAGPLLDREAFSWKELQKEL